MKVEMVPMEFILVEDRIRVEMGEIEELAASIRANGLINPILIAEIAGTDVDNPGPGGKLYRLVAGERRFRSHELLAKQGGYFPSQGNLNGVSIGEDTSIPCYIKESLSEVEYKMLELAENRNRKDFEWWEVVESEAQIHELLVAQAKKEGKKWPQHKTATFLAVSRGGLSEDLALAGWLKELPELRQARSRLGALSVLERTQEELISGEVARRIQIAATEAVAGIGIPAASEGGDKLPVEGAEAQTLALRDELDKSRAAGGRKGEIADRDQQIVDEMMMTPAHIRRSLFLEGKLADNECVSLYPNIHVMNGNGVHMMQSMAADSVDLVLTDPPYGIDRANLGPRATEFAYSDDVEYLRWLIPPVVKEMYRICKMDAHLLFFCSRELEEVLRDEINRQNDDWAPEAQFIVRSNNIIWVKHRGGFTDVRFNLAHAYESILWVYRGKKRITRPHTDIFMYKRPRRTIHAGEKPTALLRELIDIFSSPGEVILDPMGGTLSTACATMYMNRVCVSAEIEATTYSKGLEKMTRVVKRIQKALAEGIDPTTVEDGDDSEGVTTGELEMEEATT